MRPHLYVLTGKASVLAGKAGRRAGVGAAFVSACSSGVLEQAQY